MASNRYGRIYHSESNYINIRFPSVDARREYADKFQEYHAGHEHDGAVPRFEEITAATIGGFNVWDIPEADSVSIDGYHAYEIEAYHERQDDRYIKYDPPTCCVSPLISIKRKFVDSSTLTRHELSAVFGDMPEQDYQSLLESIQRDGVMDEVIRLIGDEVLDGWHRYRAAKELNLIRTLRFQQWDTREDHDGDPAAFVLARNIERRHLTPGQRAQIVVSFNQRFGHGGDRKSEDEIKSPNGELKNRQELAKAAGVGTRTIDRAVKVEKAGKSEMVIAGEKSASEVLKAQEAETLLKKKKRKLKALWDARLQACTDYVGDRDSGNALLQHQGLTLEQLQDGFPLRHPAIADAFQSGMERTKLGEGFFERFQERVLESDVSLEDLEKECKAISIYAHDISNWQEQDWIQQMIRLKSDRIKAQDANTEMWNAFEKSDLSKNLDKDDLQEVASKALQCPKNFPDPMEMKRPEIWVCWFGAITRTIEQESGWVKELLDKFREDERLDADDEKTSEVGEVRNTVANPLGELPEAQPTSPTSAEALEKFRTQKRDVYDQIDDTPPLLQWKDEFGNTNSDKALHRVMLAAYKHYDLDEALLFSDQAIQDLSADEICKLTSRYYLIARDFDVPMADWVLALLEECEASEPEVSEDAETAAAETSESKSDTTITAEDAAQMEREYPPIDDATAETESDKQDPTYDEWKEKWEPQLIEVFQSHGVEYGSVAIDQGVMKDYEKWPWNLSVEQLERLITESKTVVNHPKIPEIAWKRNRGKEGIIWALDVLGLNKESVDETTQAEKIKAILGDDTLNFITVCLRNPDRTLNYVSFDGEGGDVDRPMSDIPENILLELLKIAKNSDGGRDV